ncbi:MAG TPA: SIS domain-containing protein [Candidatus Limnocylindria bacterium]|nr:SIS domain-containing protein [Candidatus Limnocylindria bacterium]
MSFDSQAPLGAPDPWRASQMPERREGPPYAMTEMIAAEPALAERLARRLRDASSLAALATAVRDAEPRGVPVVFTGCGTSEHAAMAFVELLRDVVEARSIQAFELLRHPPARGLVVAISHEGATWATNEALNAAREAGASTALITVSAESPAGALADVVVTTDELDRSWCHTVGYLSPLVVAAALRAKLADQPLDVTSLRAVLQTADASAVTEAAAAQLADCDRLVIAGSGVDYVSARELALKVEEGAHLPAVAHALETVRHGHLASATQRTGFVLFLTDTDGIAGVLVDRATAILRSTQLLGMPAAVILAADLGDAVPLALTPAGRLPVPLASALPRVVNVALASAIPLQLLAERIARARGINPDLLARDDPRQVAAAEA